MLAFFFDQTSAIFEADASLLFSIRILLKNCSSSLYLMCSDDFNRIAKQFVSNQQFYNFIVTHDNESFFFFKNTCYDNTITILSCDSSCVVRGRVQSNLSCHNIKMSIF